MHKRGDLLLAFLLGAVVSYLVGAVIRYSMLPDGQTAGIDFPTQWTEGFVTEEHFKQAMLRQSFLDSRFIQQRTSFALWLHKHGYDLLDSHIDEITALYAPKSIAEQSRTYGTKSRR